MGNTNTEDKNTLTLINFEEAFHSTQKLLKAVHTKRELQFYIASDFQKLLDAFLRLGNDVESSSEKPIYTYLTNYIIAEDFKLLMLLHRDVFLELSKASILANENQVSDKTETNHFNNSKDTLFNALEDFVSRLVEERSNLLKQKNAEKKISRTISLQTNPWSIYKTQYDEVLNQVKHIDDQMQLAQTALEVFKHLRKELHQCSANFDVFINNLESNSNQLSDKTTSDLNIDVLISMVDAQIGKKISLENKQDKFSETIKMKKLLFLGLCLPIIFSCKNDKKTSTPIKNEEITVAKIDTVNHENENLELKNNMASEQLLELFLKKKNAVSENLKNILKNEANELYESYRNENGQIILRLIDANADILNNFYNEDSATQNLVKMKAKELSAYGLEFVELGEGLVEINTNNEFYYKIFKNYVTDDYRDYLEITKNEDKSIYAADAGLVISFRELGDRIVVWEKFMQKYSNSKLMKSVKENYKNYQKDYLFGMGQHANCTESR